MDRCTVDLHVSGATMLFEPLANAIERVRALPGGSRTTGPERRTSCICYVTECTLPRSTRGTDFCVNMQLMDASTKGDLDKGVQLILFSPHAEELPQVTSPGDIILLRSVQVQFYQDKPQLMSRLAPKWSHFYYQVYSKDEVLGQEVQPYAWGGFSCRCGREPGPLPLSADGTRLLGELRMLVASTYGAQGYEAVSDTSYLRQLCHLAPPPPSNEPGVERPPLVDIKAQVLCVDTSGEDAVVLYVWDGTDVRPLPRRLHMEPSAWRRRVGAAPGPVEILKGPARRWTMPLKAPQAQPAAGQAAAAARVARSPVAVGRAGSSRSPGAAAAASGRPSGDPAGSGDLTSRAAAQSGVSEGDAMAQRARPGRASVGAGAPGGEATAAAAAGAGEQGGTAAAAAGAAAGEAGAAAGGGRGAAAAGGGGGGAAADRQQHAGQQELPVVTLMEQLPRFGTALPVVVVPRWHGGKQRSMAFPRVGDWVRIKVVGLHLVQGQLQAIMGSAGSFAPMSAPPAKQMAVYATRLHHNITCSQLPPHLPPDPPPEGGAAAAAAGTSAGQSDAAAENGQRAGVDPLTLLPPITPPCVGWRVTRCMAPGLAHVTVREVLMAQHQAVPQTFCLWVRISDFWPEKMEEWCKLAPPDTTAAAPGSAAEEGAGAGAGSSLAGNKRPREGEQQFRWLFKCRLEDATGELDALVFGSYAEQLLGTPASDLAASPEAVSQLRDVMSRLTEVAADGSGAAWLDLALTCLPQAAAAPPVYYVQDAMPLTAGELEVELKAREVHLSHQQSQ